MNSTERERKREREWFVAYSINWNFLCKILLNREVSAIGHITYVHTVHRVADK